MPNIRKVAGISTLLLMLLGASVHLGQAQSLGIVGGLNYASIDDVMLGQVQTTYENHIGFHLGAYLDIGVGMLAVRPGIHFTWAGSLLEGLSEDIGNDVVFQDGFDVNVFTVPIDVRLELPLPTVRPYIFGGPALHYRLISDAPEAIEDDLRITDIAGTTGIGVRVILPGSDLVLSPEIRYTFGLTGLIGETLTLGDLVLQTEGEQSMDLVLLSLGVEF